uniref:Uncharacterized protein n=1 Tax=Lepeophtheirus salmonis TaxID=72036 RepID=A0A0K2TEU9_LEPSM
MTVQSSAKNRVITADEKRLGLWDPLNPFIFVILPLGLLRYQRMMFVGHYIFNYVAI